MNRTLASFLLVLITTGCASVYQTFVNPPAVDSLVYVGARTDWQYATFQCGAPVDLINCHEGTNYFGGVGWVAGALDLPLSVTADTLFLPYTLLRSSSN